MDLFRKKSVDQLVAESTPLKRTMHTFDLTMLGIGAIIGTGIFVLTGKGALTAGPALMVSFLLAAVCCGFAGLCYAEFASMAPVSGSAYSYAYLAFGELIAFVIGWDLILEYALQAATVSAGWSGYFNKLLEGFGLHLPVELTAAYGTNPNTTTYFNLPGFVIVLLITWVLSIGINQTKKANDIMVLIKLAIIVLFIVCVIWYVNPSNWKPFAPYGIYQFQPGSTQPYGIVPAASIVFFSFIGFDAVSSSAEETVNPNRTLPRGILYSLVISTILYIVMTLIMTGVVPYEQFAQFIDAPVAGVILKTGMNWLAVIVNLGALIGMTTVMLVQLYGHQRAVRAGEHRYAVRVHHCVGRRDVDAQDPAGRASRVPRSGRAVHTDSGNRILHGADRRSQLGDLGAVRGLVRPGTDRLLRLQPQALQAERIRRGITCSRWQGLSRSNWGWSSRPVVHQTTLGLAARDSSRQREHVRRLRSNAGDAPLFRAGRYHS